MTPRPGVSNPLLAAALGYADVGWRVLPVKGKKPASRNGSKDATTDTKQIETWWREWPDCNIGLATGQDFFVLDVDPGHGGQDSLDRLEARFGKLPETIRQVTGGGGTHYLLAPPSDMAVKNSASSLGPGLDIRGVGGYIVAEPSLHPDTGQRYKFVNISDAEIALAPGWLINRLHDKPKQMIFPFDGTIPQGSRNEQLFRYASALRGIGLGPNEILSQLAVTNQTCCNPPLSAQEVKMIAGSASRYAPNSNGLIQMGSRSVSLQPADSVAYFRVSANGKPERILANVVAAFTSAPHWINAFCFDEFSQKPLAQRDLLHGLIPIGTEIGDHQVSLVTVAVQTEDGILVSSSVVTEAIITVAKLNPLHSVCNYLGSLKWDGEARIGRWLSTYLGVQPSLYSEAIGPRWLIGAIARVKKPGCKMDTCLILEGAQGSGRSTASNTLGNPWYTDDIGEIGTKDSLLQMQGKWIIEFSELDALSRHEASKVKAFISRQADNFRPPYGRVSADVPRQCVFVGTVNDQSYLKDDTGARRFWPVRTGFIDIEALRRDKDQLWAEAFHCYSEGHHWHLDTEALRTEAEDQQKARYDEDVWQPAVESYCVLHSDVSIDEVLAEAIGKPREQWTQADKKRVARCLRANGYQEYRVTTGDRPRRYRVLD